MAASPHSHNENSAGVRVGLALAALALPAGLIAVLQPTLAAGGLALLLISALVGLYFVRPHWALLTFVVVLPVHSLLITLLIAQVGLPLSLGRVAAAWKELLLVGTFGAVVLQTLLRSKLPRLCWIDGVAFVWLLLVLGHFGVALLLRPGLPLTALAYGARDWLLYLLPYFIGRLVMFSADNVRTVLVTIAGIGFATSLFGILEYLFIPTSWWIALGVPLYFRDFLGLAYPDYLGGLPYNFWAEVAGLPVRRAVSTYLSGQGFAVPFLVILPVVIVRFLGRPSFVNLGLLVVCGVALLLAITRMTIIACAVQALVLLWIYPRRLWVALAVALGIALLIAGVAGSASLREFVVDTVTLSDTSGSARPDQWISGLRTLIEHPLGQGLGFSGQVGARFGSGGGGVGSEAGYFKVTGDLGLIGLALFGAWFGGLLLAGRALTRMQTGIWRDLGMVTFAASIGFLLNMLTAPPDQSPFTIYVFAWLAGLTVRAAVADVPMRNSSSSNSAVKRATGDK
jgi:hypothetical protein